MANPAIATPTLLTDPGFLYWAPIGSTLPTNTVVGSVFTDTWPVAWLAQGMTEAGTTLTPSLTVEPIEAAEIFDPLAYRTTGRRAQVEFMLKNATASNLAHAYNTTSAVVSGSGTTLLTKVSPPNPGSEIRCMIGFESLDSTYRFICYQVINSGDVALTFAKAPSNTNIPWSAQCEKPASTPPWDMWTAGAARGA